MAVDRDDGLASDAQSTKLGREPAAGRVEVAVGPGADGIDQCEMIGTLTGPAREELVNGAVPLGSERRAGIGKHAAGRIGDERQPADSLSRIVDELGEQGFELAESARRSDRGEERRAVDDAEVQRAVPLHRVQRQVEIRACRRPVRPRLAAARCLGEVVEEHLEEGVRLGSRGGWRRSRSCSKGTS